MTCEYPFSEPCSGPDGGFGFLPASMMTPRELAAVRVTEPVISNRFGLNTMRAAGGTARFPIDLVEPCPARIEGDRVPCHLFLPDVAWPAPLGPILRPIPRRDAWLQRPVQPWSPIEPSTDLLEPLGFNRVVAVIGIVWVCAAAATLVARVLGVV